ncbi:MAG: hypothetical protein WCW13_03345 [archaeon]|jgi:hypothetical protein
MITKNKVNKKVFVRVCPNCFSPKLNSHLGLTGEGFKCMDCGFDNFQPLEFEKGKEPKIKKGI